MRTVGRRAFLAGTVGVAAGALTAPRSLAARLQPADSILDLPASESPIDTVVVVMMENRSFDHYLGWLANDDAYLDAGRRRYGSRFRVDGAVDQTYLDPFDQPVATRPASAGPERIESRGCRFRAPGHTWIASRVQRDKGFLAKGTGNDDFAVTYYRAEDLPIYASLARRFTVFDDWHASLLGPTFPNRQYYLSAQSEGRTKDPVPPREGMYKAETIVDRLAAAGVPVGYYHTSVALLALWGADRMAPYIRSLDRYFEDASAGTLPRVVFVEPGFGIGDALRTDDHPRGDIGLGQRWVRAVFEAFVSSPHWERGAFILTYDEHGGFFDHVRPPLMPDGRASPIDIDNFGQAGFRVPAFLASPYSRPGAVDHRRYDHTAILRFLEWRFLGAPAEGHPGRALWALTLRDRGSLNPGITLRSAQPDPELGFDLGVTLRPPAEPCTAAQVAARTQADLDPDPFAAPALQDLVPRFPGATYEPWLADVPFAGGAPSP